MEYISPKYHCTIPREDFPTTHPETWKCVALRSYPHFPPPRYPGYNHGMATVLATLGVALAAFAVWLAVRLANRGWKPGGRAWLCATLSVALVGYPLSFGPACRIAANGILSIEQIGFAYKPIVYLMTDGPQCLSPVIMEYASVCGGEDTVLELLIIKINRVLSSFVEN
jgi:hypothetical protein